MDTVTTPIDFMKLHGSGNDFVVIDNRGGVLAESEIGEFSQLVTRRAKSIGADGVVLIENPVEPKTDFRWRYFNADGSEGEMCGNGAMCGARFAERRGTTASPRPAAATACSTTLTSVEPIGSEGVSTRGAVMPILRAVLMTRQAISPRLAISIFLNMGLT